PALPIQKFFYSSVHLINQAVRYYNLGSCIYIPHFRLFQQELAVFGIAVSPCPPVFSRGRTLFAAPFLMVF
ncbi:MAG TPA: hypothetical protein P5310_06035, partial [bacterium]|nr:hypothetical protein [bacterium]